MTISPEVSGTAFRLVRAARARTMSTTAPVWEDESGKVMGVLAAMAAGLLEDLCYATGQDPEALLDVMECASLERTLG